MSVKPTFRLLRADDADACAALHAQAFAAPWPAHDIRRQIESPDRVANGAAFASGPVTGFVITRFVADEADLLTIVVDRAARGKGLAQGLLQYHLGALARHGVSRVFLEVEAANNAAQRLYAKFAFVKVGARPGYYGRDTRKPADALVLRCDL